MSGDPRNVEGRVQLVGAIVGPVAHELNNVSGALRMALALIGGDSEAGTPADAEDLAALKSLLTRIEELASALDELARPKLDAPPTGVRTTAERIVALLARLGRTRTATVTVTGDDLAVALGRLPLEELLFHLTANALEAFRNVRRAERTVNLAFARSIDGASAECVVADNGAGVAADLLADVFTPHVTTKPHAAGRGLARVREIAEGIGGNVTIESAVDVGTTVRVRLPLEPAACVEANPLPHRDAEGRATR